MATNESYELRMNEFSDSLLDTPIKILSDSIRTAEDRKERERERKRERERELKRKHAYNYEIFGETSPRVIRWRMLLQTRN